MRFNTEEKAKDLIEKIGDFIYTSNAHNADEEADKNIALLCVNEVLEILYDEGYDEDDYKIIKWLEVKRKLETF